MMNVTVPIPFTPAEVIFSEVMASNGVYKNGEAYDWIEIYNSGKKTVNLSGCYLSDSAKRFEDYLKANTLF